MKSIKKLICFTMISIITLSIYIFKIYAINDDTKPTNVAILLFDSTNPYISEVSKQLKDIEVSNSDNIKFKFFDAEDNSTLQDNQLREVLQKDFDLILLNIVDTSASSEYINLIKEKNIPVILFNREPIDINSVKSYGKSFFVGTNSKEAGNLQGNIILELISNNKLNDRNNNAMIDYIMLEGEKNNIEAMDRTKYSIKTLNDNGIKTNKLDSILCNWEESCAEFQLSSSLLGYIDNIDVIISNNDAMAIGAVTALQKLGYNTGSSSNYIPVIGIDALKTARDLISKGYMSGTVIQDDKEMAKALYEIGLNLVNKKPPLYNTNYKADDTGVAVRIPYSGTLITDK